MAVRDAHSRTVFHRVSILIFVTSLNQLPEAAIAASLPLQFLSPTKASRKLQSKIVDFQQMIFVWS